jgi:hypothetical protein
MAGTPEIVRTFWHGGGLSVYERLSLRSFLASGHEVEIYLYDAVDVPDGVKVCSAEDIIPRSEIFAYASGPAKGSYTAVANLFRYRLLLEKGGIWSDLDVLCLRPLRDLPDACVGRTHNKKSLNNDIMKFPAGHPLCRDLADAAQAMGADIKMGEAGPALLTRLLSSRSYECECLEAFAFAPFAPREALRLLDPRSARECEERTQLSYCVHWYNTLVRLAGFPKDVLPPEGSYLHARAEELFGVGAHAAAPVGIAQMWIDNFEQAKQYARFHKANRHKLERPVTTLLRSDYRIVLSDVAQMARGAVRRVGRALGMRA